MHGTPHDHEEMDEEYDMLLPDPAVYTDMHANSEVPLHSIQQLKLYLKNNEKDLDEKCPCGLIIHENYPWSGASPDRLVDDSAILEVMCPYTARNLKITTVTVPFLKTECGKFCLDQQHDYYYQIQGQLACTKRDMCYFRVFTTKDMAVCEIRRNDEFINEMIEKLNLMSNLSP